ncbi:hypothetical protein Syun_022343 [Stephania yunnanensis]|uniref:Uncharacterized protein n=1 Tax=Stephania yunnanensis TaxID=152371 RepID=A0AAP0I1G3_9MAGN
MAGKKVKEKMQNTLKSVDNSIERVANEGSSTLSGEVLDQKNDESTKEPELSAVILKGPEGYLILTFLEIGPDQRKLVLALQSSSDPEDQPGSGGHSVGDSGLVFYPITDILRFDPQSARGSHLADRAHSAKSVMASHLSQSSAPEESRYRRVLNRRAKAASKIHESSEDNSTISSNSSILIEDESKSSCSTDLVKDKRKADKPVKRNSKKKAKKKGKRCKPVCFAESSRVEAFCEESICQSSLSEAGANAGSAWDDRSISDKSVENGPLHDICMDRSDYEKNNRSIINLPEIASPIPQGEIRSTSDSKVTDSCQKRASYFKNVSSEAVPDVHNGSMLDSISDGWNSDFSANGGDYLEEKSFIEGNNGISISGSVGGDSTQDRFGRRQPFQDNLSNDVVHVDNQAERTKCDPQGCGSSDFHLVVHRKRGRQRTKQYGSSIGVDKFNSGGNAHGRCGKEKTNSVWQIRSQRGNHPLVPQSSGEPPVGSTITSEAIPESNGNHKSNVRAVEKMKRKNVGPKQEYTCHSRKRPPAPIYITKSSRDARTNTGQEEASELPSEVDHQKGILASPRSHIYTYSGGGKNPSCSINSLPESVQLECAPAQVLNIDDQSNSNESWLSSGTAKASDPKPLFEVHSDGSLSPPFNSGPAGSQAEISDAENVEQEHHSGSVLQKGMAARSDAEMTAPSGSGNLVTSNIDESDKNDCKITDKERLSSCVCNSVPLKNVVVKSVGISGDKSHPAPNDEVQIENSRSGNPYCTSAVTYHAITHEPEYANKCVPETILNMTQAIEDSYKMQLASEGVHMATGRPLAEFERLLYSASPYIGQAQSIGKCNLCSCNQFTGACTCLHEIPNISLGSLWQWYEKHGSYGLEVKVEDIPNSKRMDSAISEFRAYFVPYLSAVQLFGRGCSMSSCTVIPVRDVLIPLENQALRPQNSPCTSELSPASGQEWYSSPSLRTTCFDESQLLFEFFESGRPQHRPPLFEKIKELIRGEMTSDLQVYGDPTALESLHLHDIHPASWYSVAWYPIYKIPDASFRASFLTFHSFGHWIHRSSSSDCFGGDSSIVCPVVGLQSYNSQNEGWFQLRQPVATRAEQTMNYSELLKERLRTLQEAANVMARGVVRKGNERATNRQPDYEFFLSRRRW